MTTAKLMINPMIRMACAVLFSVTAMVAGAADGAREATNVRKITLKIFPTRHCRAARLK